MKYAAARDLLEARIRSIEEVDVLLVLRSSDRALTVPEVVRSTQIGPDLVRTALASLLAHGLVLVGREGFVYAASSFAMDCAVAELERLNGDDRAEVLAILASTAMQRVRSGVSELFAEALRRNARGREH